MMKKKSPRIAITMGDPGGIGPEVALKAAAGAAVLRVCEPLVLGDLDHLDAVARGLGIAVVPDTGSGCGGGGCHRAVRVIDTGGVLRKVTYGRPSVQGGRAAGAAIEGAVEAALAGGAAGICTAPVSKESLALAGYGMVGHTELLAKLTGTRRYAMMLARGGLRVVFATTHVPVSRVAASLRRSGLVGKMAMACEFLRGCEGIRRPRLGVCCLNPHCGEGGRLGGEEKTIIAPAVRAARKRGISAEGPFPADSIFGKSLATGFDAIVAMYHDQGMIPLKMMSQEEVVNITLGIPVVRTSPGHGTAFDIAGGGTADHRGMVRAIVECARIAVRMRHAR
jgi:4-hydroxythreonine-4-phosphate dehydrogenase